MTNPLLSDWSTPFGLPPFSALSDEDFAPALDIALEEARGELAAIRDNGDAPTFSNTIEALELMGEGLEKVLGPFYALAGSDSNAAREALQRDFAPKLSAFFSEMTMDEALFARIDALWEARDTLDLTDEQARVLMLRHRGFVRSGARLTGEDSLARPVSAGATEDNAPIVYSLRFHLHPTVTAVMAGDSIVLHSDLGTKWRFKTSHAKAQLEETIYLGRGIIERSEQIVLSGKAFPNSDGSTPPNCIRWAFLKVTSA